MKLSSSTPWGFLDWGEKGTLQLALVLAGVAAMVSSATVLIAAHFYYRRRSKLAHLATGDTEPSQDYQVVSIIHGCVYIYINNVETI